MPIVKVYGMPDRIGQHILTSLMVTLQLAVANVEPLNIPMTDVTVFFPTDQLKAGLGKELVVQIEGLYKKPERTETVLKQLQDSVFAGLKEFALIHLPECSYVETIIMPMIEPKDCTYGVIRDRTP